MAFYTQVDGVAVGSPLGSSLANASLFHHDAKRLNDCPEKFKPVFYKNYVDDIFGLFKSPEHVIPFVDYMNSKHKNINFSFETGKDEQMPFVDVDVFRKKKMNKCPSLMSTYSVRMVSLSLMFTEKKHSAEFILTFIVLYH